ncbi:MAG: hypothetical protein DWQ04_08135 [Chloroflexi bacterium]|nr:MAG: hypothetical protein DWQ04_08135 [Chloroflexota bacterium]
MISCQTTSPETVTLKETVIAEVPVTVEVTRIVEVAEEVEVTRDIETLNKVDPPRGTTIVKELVHGAPIHGTNGLAFDSQNHLYIASALGREIVMMNPRSGKILDRYGPSSGVEGPDDVTFGPDGSLYWTAILSGEVGRMAPDGSVTTQFVAPFVNPITFSDDGRLFVAQAFVDDGLYEVDPELVEPPKLILHTGNPANHLNAFDFGPDGLLYAPRQQLNQIVRIDVDAEPEPTVEILTDQFHGAVKFDASGQLYVLADGADGLVQFDPDSGDVTVIAEVPLGSDNMAFDANGNIYVSNFRDGSVLRVLPSGGTVLLSPGGLVAPGGIAVLPDSHAGESLLVADFWTVREYDGRNGRSGIVGQDFFFDSPLSASADGENVILTSWFGNTLEVWNPEAGEILEVHGDFAAPLNAIRFQGDFVVAELGTGSLIRQDGNTGERSVLANGFAVPSGLAAADDNLWMADWASGIIWQIVADGVVLETPVEIASGLLFPEGLAVDHDNSLLVVESGAGRLSRIDLGTGEVTTVVDELSLGLPAPANWPPTWFFNDVAVGEQGDIYVTGDVDNVIYRIRVRP